MRRACARCAVSGRQRWSWPTSPQGRIDGLWEAYLRPWDTAAGLLMVAEAGGAATDFEGRADGLRRGQVVASNGRIHAELLAALAGRA
ncbi:MAG: inositol monophosphatase family protein [Aggregatilineales bacterium]